MHAYQHLACEREPRNVDVRLGAAAERSIAVRVLAGDDELGECEFTNVELTAVDRMVWLHRHEVCCGRLLTWGFVEV